MNYSQLNNDPGTPDMAAEITLYGFLSVFAFLFTLIIVLHALANNAVPVTQAQNTFAFNVAVAFGLATFGLSLVFKAFELS
jgi:hypothetical protein